MRLNSFYHNNKIYITLFFLFVSNAIFFFYMGTRYAKTGNKSYEERRTEGIKIEDKRNKELIVATSAFSPYFDFLAHNLISSKYVSSSFKERGLWESPQSGFIEDLFKNVAPKDGSFIEVGANIGWFAFIVANTGHKVYAIEPYTYNLEILRANLAINPQFSSNIHVIPILSIFFFFLYFFFLI